MFTIIAVLVEWRLSQNTVWNIGNSLNQNIKRSNQMFDIQQQQQEEKQHSGKSKKMTKKQAKRNGSKVYRR